MSGPELPGLPAQNSFFEIKPTNKKIKPIEPGAEINPAARDLPHHSGREFLVDENSITPTEDGKNKTFTDVVETGRQPDSIDKLKNYGRNGRLEK